MRPIGAGRMRWPNLPTINGPKSLSRGNSLGVYARDQDTTFGRFSGGQISVIDDYGVQSLERKFRAKKPYVVRDMKR